MKKRTGQPPLSLSATHTTLSITYNPPRPLTTHLHPVQHQHQPLSHHHGPLQNNHPSPPGFQTPANDDDVSILRGEEEREG